MCVDGSVGQWVGSGQITKNLINLDLIEMIQFCLKIYVHVPVITVKSQQLFLPPATKLGQGNIFRSVCQEFCPQGDIYFRTLNVLQFKKCEYFILFNQHISEVILAVICLLIIFCSKSFLLGNCFQNHCLMAIKACGESYDLLVLRVREIYFVIKFLITRWRIGISSVPGWELNWVFIKYVGLTRPKRRYGSVHKH